MRKRTVNQLHKMKNDKQYSDVDWNMLNEYLPEKLIEEVDSKRISNVYRRFTITSNSLYNPSLYSSPKTTITNIELKEIPIIFETDYVPINFRSSPQEISHQEIDSQSDDKKLNNELTIRFLTALSFDYEKQWYRGMIRRRTLYILIKSIEKAKHQHSLKLHWKLIVENFRVSKCLLNLMRFDYVNWINKQFNKLLFDRIFLTIELTLGK
jgi:hypothetical protein